MKGKTRLSKANWQTHIVFVLPAPQKFLQVALQGLRLTLAFAKAEETFSRSPKSLDIVRVENHDLRIDKVQRMIDCGMVITSTFA